MGTLLGILLPAFTPQCHRFVEVGGIFIERQEDAKFIEVSPDGTIECISESNMHQCSNRLNLPVAPFAIEMKCPFGPLKNPRMLPVHYSPPHYYACQLLCELVATRRHILWYLSCSPESVTLTFVDYDLDTWKELWDLALDYYGSDTLVKPKRLHPDIKDHRQRLKEYIDANSTFVAEVPTVSCVDLRRSAATPMQSDPCFRRRRHVPTKLQSDIDIEAIKNSVLNACTESMKAIQEAHDLERRKATEILLFVATDTDREFDKEKPVAIPVAYALKGKSIKMAVAREMMHIVRKKLTESGVNIVAEAFDGQYAQLVFRSTHDEPLTLFEFCRDCWNTFATLSKKKMLEIVNSMSEVTAENLKSWSETIAMEEGDDVRIGNVNVTCEVHSAGRKSRYLSVQSYCGPFDDMGGLAEMPVPLMNARPDVWVPSQYQKYNLLHILELTDERPRTNVSRQSSIGVQVSVDDFLEEQQQFQAEIENLRHDIFDVDDFEDVDLSNNVYAEEAVVPTAQQIRQLLFEKKKYVIESILISLLCSARQDKWTSLDADEFVDKVFNSSQSIMNELTKEELKIVIAQIKHYECVDFPLVIKGPDTKANIAQQLAFVFGFTDVIQVKKAKVKMAALTVLCTTVLKKCVPNAVLQVSMASWKFNRGLGKWLNKSTVPMTCKIPVIPFEFDMFSYPELCTESDKAMARLIDPSHLLTNLRLHATQKGFFGCSKDAFVKVSKQFPRLLSRAIIEEPIIDKQSVPIACKVFSYDVEVAMRNNGDTREANMVEKVRKWYDACDKRGLSVSTRIKYLVDMSNYMLSHFKSGHFPMCTTHIAGLPSTTFQGVVANVSTRLQLYSLCSAKKFNHRCMGTLAVENMFAALSAFAKNSSGCPLAMQIPRYIGKMTQLNHMQNDVTK